jgi:hypothetical protein
MNDRRSDQTELLAALRELPEAALVEKLHDIAAEEARLAALRSVVQACLARHLSVAGHAPAARLLTAQDVHRILGVPVAYAYELMRRDVLACTAIGKYRRVDPRDLDAFLSKNRLQPREDAQYTPRGARRTRETKSRPTSGPDQLKTAVASGSAAPLKRVTRILVRLEELGDVPSRPDPW